MAVMNSPYHTDPLIREEIDKVLHHNVKMFQNLGVSSTKSERNAVKVQERKNLRAVRDLDPEFIGSLLDHSD